MSVAGRLSRAGRLEVPRVALHAPHMALEDRTACGRSIHERELAGRGLPITCGVCLGAMGERDVEVWRARRRGYARALLRLRNENRARFDDLWEQEVVAALAAIGRGDG